MTQNDYAEDYKKVAERPNFFPGQYLLDDEFESLHNYHATQQRLHNRFLHVSGIVQGLDVTDVTSVSGQAKVKVSAGTAIDPAGNLIVLTQEKEVILSGTDTIVELYISFAESKIKQQEPDKDFTFTRYQANPTIAFRTPAASPSASPSPPANAVILAKLTWSTSKVSQIDLSSRKMSGLLLPSPAGNLALRYHNSALPAQSSASTTSQSLETAWLSGHLGIAGDLSVTGNSTLNAGLSVTGASTLNGSLTVNNTVSLKGAADKTGLTIDNQGNTNLGGTLTVTGNSTLNGTLKLKEGIAIKQFSSTTPLADSINSVPTESVVKTYVDAINTTLASQKADKAGASTQDFNAKILTVAEALTIGTGATAINVKNAVDGKANKSGDLSQDFSAKNLTVQESLSVSQIKIPASKTGIQNIELLPKGTGTGQQYQAGQVILGKNTDNEKANLTVNGNVGIGTTTPKIHLAIGDNDTGLNQQGDGQLAVYTNNQERLRIDSSGNIGIGVINPASKLDIQTGTRSGTHPTTVRGLYITGDFGESSGIELRKSDASEGIGFGCNTIYAAGNNSSQNLSLKAKGNGEVTIGSNLRLRQGVVISKLSTDPLNTSTTSSTESAVIYMPVLQAQDQSDLVDLGDASKLNPTGDQWTVELWFKSDSSSNSLYSKHRAYEAYIKDWYFLSGWTFSDELNWRGKTTFQVVAGQWYHAAVVYNGNMIIHYRNGFPVHRESVSGTLAGTFLSEKSSLFLLRGWEGDDQTEASQGSIREFRIWSTARTAGQIRDNMYATLQGNESGLVGYWPMNEGQGTTVYDKTENPANGTITGATWVQQNILENENGNKILSRDNGATQESRIVWENGAAIASRPGTNLNAGDLRFQTASNGSLQERMIINSFGNVGIGTTTPSAKLQVEGGALSVTNRDSSNNTWGLEIEAGSQPDASRRIGVSQIKATATGTGTGIQNIELLPRGTGTNQQYQAGQVIIGKNEVDGRANLTVNGEMRAGSLQLDASVSSGLLVADRASIAALQSPSLRSIVLTPPVDTTTSRRKWEHKTSSAEWLDVITGQLDLETVATNAYATFIANGHVLLRENAEACDFAIFIDGTPAMDVEHGDSPYGVGISHVKTWVPIQTLASRPLRGRKKYNVALRMRSRNSKGEVSLSGPLMIILLTGGT